MRRTIVIALINIIALVLGMEIILRVIDPWGALALRDNIITLHDNMIWTEDRNRLPAGVYTFPNFSVTILDDGTRLVPDAIDHDCTIAIVGDSIAWGHGADDDTQWINLVAQQVDARIINAAMTGYNSTDVLRTIDDVDADGYVYLVFRNDAAERLQPYWHLQDLSALGVYRWWLDQRWDRFALRYNYAAQYRGIDRFLDDIEAMSRDDVLLMGFEGDVLAIAAGAILIPPYTSVVSVVDPHADVIGNRQLADAALPVVAEFVEAIC